MGDILSENMKSNGFELLKFETNCYFQFLKLLLELFGKEKAPIKFGVEQGFDSFIGFSAQLDCSVFLYEALTFLESIAPGTVKEIAATDFQKDLKIIRNNMHTYNKSGDYSRKAKGIIQDKLAEYKMEKRDILYPLRNDISLVFIIVDQSRRLIGSDQIYYHFIYESDNRTWSGARIMEYSQNLSATIKGFASVFEDSIYQLAKLTPADKIPCIELFDYKSADLFSRAGISDTVAFRLMLILSQISYGLILIDHLVDTGTIQQSELWTCFFTKLLAIKYDEAFDNIQSIYDHADATDSSSLRNTLEANKINIDKLHAKEFARKLRNTIHYNDIMIDTSCCDDDTTRSWIKAIYLTNSGALGMTEFLEQKDTMIAEMYCLQRAIQDCFSLNKSYG